MHLITRGQEVCGWETRQDVLLPLIGCEWEVHTLDLMGNTLAPRFCLFKPLGNMTRGHFLGAQMWDLARIH